jgi:hypothetical protein
MVKFAMRFSLVWCLVDPDPAGVPAAVERWLADRPDREELAPHAGALVALLERACADAAASGGVSAADGDQVGVLALPVDGTLYAGLLFVVRWAVEGQPSAPEPLPPPWADAEAGTLALEGGGVAVRVRRLDERPAAAGEDTLVTDTTHYWLLHPDLPEAVQLTFVTPHLVLADQLVAMADEAVASLRWSEP